MNIYFSGIGGVGIGPLAEIAHDAGYTVAGSDMHESLMTKHLEERGISVSFDQSGANLESRHQETPFDWFVFTAALPETHPELTTARALGIRTAKRDQLLNEIIRDKNLKLIAVAGTHGKTTTSGMLVWVMKQLGIPVSYSVGSTLSFGPSGAYHPSSEYFIYECDEYDRNFLHFHPYLSLITAVDYDHPDTYPTRAAYDSAFDTFIAQSNHVILWDRDHHERHVPSSAWLLHDDDALELPLTGQHNRANATLVVKACEFLGIEPLDDAMRAASEFPGTGRRFEKLAENLYSDYGHHPKEIAATLQMARELSEHIVLVYQPHQNSRQHEMQNQYTDCMQDAEKIYWLPTYLTRETPELPILSPEELSTHLVNRSVVEYADLDNHLWESIKNNLAAGRLVLCMGAGSIDDWLRNKLTNS